MGIHHSFSLVYNMDTRTIEKYVDYLEPLNQLVLTTQPIHYSQTPVLNDVRDITVAQGATHALALVSYENQVSPNHLPPVLLLQTSCRCALASVLHPSH